MNPTSRSHDSDSNRPTTTRRRALAAVAGASTIGLGALAVGSQDTSASIALDQLSVPDASHSADDPEPTPVVAVTAALEYDVESLDELTVELLVGSETDDRQPIDSETMSTSVTATDTTRDLEGPITDAAAFDREMFQPGPEETTTEPVSLALRLTITDGDDVVAEALAEETTAIEVINTAEAVVARIGGTGEIRFE